MFNLIRQPLQVLAASLCLLGTTASTCRAWDAGGHMIAAQIAYNQLPPTTRDKADQTLKGLPDFRSDTKARPYDFVTAATWMDDIKASHKRDGLSSLHYVDAECGQDPDAVEATNALDALKMARVVLRSPEADAKLRAEWLAIAIHVIGDLHQPLHTCERDRGGNDFPVAPLPGLTTTFRPKEDPNGGPTYGRLHQLWDFGYRYGVEDGRVKLLFDIDFSEHPDLKRVQAFAQKAHTSPLAIENLNPSDWARESNALACEFAFSTTPRALPSNDYIQHMQALCQARLALAGQRMAAWIVDVLGQ